MAIELVHVLFSLFLLGRSEALIGYSCDIANANYTTLSLVDLPVCEYKRINAQNQSIYGYVVQSIRHEPIRAHICMLRMTRLVHNCDYLGSSEASTNDIVSWPVSLSASECQTIIRDRRYVTAYGRTVWGIGINTTTVKPLTLIGETSFRGKCSGSEYNDEWGTYSNVVVTASLEFTIKEVTATHDIGNDAVIFPSGVNCRYGSEECVDASLNTYIWSAKTVDSCDLDALRVIYEGNLELLTVDYGSSSQTSEVKSVRYIIVVQETRTLALRLQDDTILCNIETYNTNVEHIMVLVPFEKQKLKLQKGVPALDVSIDLQYLSKLTGVDLFLSQQLNELASALMFNDCQNERSVMELKLHLAATDPVEFAYVYNGGPGATAVAAGEVVHVIKCTPVFVAFQPSSNCYKEITVSFQNKTWFMNARTRILQDYGSPIPCSTIFGNVVRDGGTWYGVNPSPHIVVPPTVLSTGMRVDWHFRSLSKVIEGGLYSRKEIDNARDAMLQPYQESSVSSVWAIHGGRRSRNTDSIDVEDLIGKDTISKWIDQRIDDLWGMMVSFGTFSAGVMGAIVFYNIVSQCIALFLDLHTLHRIYGFSWHLLLAFGHGLAAMFLARQHRAWWNEHFSNTRGGNSSELNSDVNHELHEINREDESSALINGIPDTPPVDRAVHSSQPMMNGSRYCPIYPVSNIATSAPKSIGGHGDGTA